MCGVTLEAQKLAKRASLPLRRSTRSLAGLLRLKLGQGEESAEPLDFPRRQVERLGVAGGEFGLDRLAERLDALLVDEDLDARLELVVAPAFQIVDAQDRFDVAEQVALRQEVADLAADHRRSAEAAADIDGKADLAGVVANHLQADVVGLDHRPVMRRAVHRNLEFSRQERELRMQRRPLAQDLRVRARIGDFVVRDAGEMIGRDVANAVAGGLDRVHLDACELGQDIGRVLERGPVVLDVLPGREMAIAAIVAARDLGELAHLARVQDAIGHRDPQHIGVQLQIEAVHQPMRTELLLGQFAGKAARDLVAELLDPGGDERGVEIRHSDTWSASVAAALGPVRGARPAACLPRSRRLVGPAARIASRSAFGAKWPLRSSTGTA